MPSNPIQDKPFFKSAFTLAEVLITLAIIGVVAAMTIPTMIQDTDHRETASAVKKVFATMTNAYTLAVQENGTPENWNTESGTALGSANMINPLVPYLKLAAHCGTATSCFPDTYPLISNTKVAIGADIRDTLHLPDGVLIRAFATSATCASPTGNTKALSNRCGIYNVDINGFKKPNRGGIDQFSFWLTKYGIIPVGTKDDVYYPFPGNCNKTDTGGNNGWGCAAWILYNENMDYLKCTGLSWTGKTNCK